MGSTESRYGIHEVDAAVPAASDRAGTARSTQETSGVSGRQHPGWTASVRKAVGVLWYVAAAGMALAEPESIPLPGEGRIDVFVERPAAIPAGGAPLCIVFGGGSGAGDMAQAALKQLGKPMAQRGWWVAAPVAADGRSFFSNNARRIVALIATLQAREDVSDARVVLAGESNGGISAIHIASLTPSNIAAVMAVPGLPVRALKPDQLKGVPLFIRVGAKDDLGWGKSYERAIQSLTRAGARLDARLLPEAGHGIPLDWTEIEAWLRQALGPAYPAPALPAIALP